MNKANLKEAGKLYARSYLAGIMGIFIWLSIGIIVGLAFPNEDGPLGGPAMMVVNAVSLFLQGGLFFVIIYGKLWELGDRDSNSASFGHIVGDPLRGLKIGLLAAIPSCISWIVLVADKVFGFWGHMATAYRLCQSGLYGAIVMAMGSNIELQTAQISQGGILAAGLPVLFMPTVAALAYYLGYRHILVWEKLVFVRKKK